MRSAESFPGTHPYAGDERELLHAVRELVRADAEMRRALSRRMTVGATDLRAIRFVMSSTRSDRLTTPHELAEHLGITTAATTVMLDRLSAAGHLERVPHPTDRRAKVVVATEHAYDEVRTQLSGAHDKMRAAAASLPATARPAVISFLEALTEIMREDAETS